MNQRIQTDPLAKAARHLPVNAGDHWNKEHDNPLLVSEQIAAKMLGISPRKLWALRTAGAVPFVPIDRRTMYPVAGLRAWVDAGCPTTPDAASSLNWKGGAQ